MLILGDLRSTEGFESTDLGERSIKRRVFGNGEDELESDLAGALAILLTLGVAGAVLLGRVSDKPVLSNTEIADFHNQIKSIQYTQRHERTQI